MTATTKQVRSVRTYNKKSLKRNGHEPTDKNPKGAGRPKGAKGATTILREAVKTGSEEVILKHLPRIVEVVCREAEKGNIRAAKLIMDRIIPPQRAIDDVDRGQAGGIQIFVQGSSPTKIQATKGGKTETLEVKPNE
jgi:hypothetical protein